MAIFEVYTKSGMNITIHGPDTDEDIAALILPALDREAFGYLRTQRRRKKREEAEQDSRGDSNVRAA